MIPECVHWKSYSQMCKPKKIWANLADEGSPIRDTACRYLNSWAPTGGAVAGAVGLGLATLFFTPIIGVLTGAIVGIAGYVVGAYRENAKIYSTIAYQIDTIYVEDCKNEKSHFYDLNHEVANAWLNKNLGKVLGVFNNNLK